MIEKLNTLNGIGQGEFTSISNTIYKSDKADAIVLTRVELEEMLKLRVKEEIPYTKNSILKKHLPKKFKNKLILNEMKELSKFDHTLLSNLIVDEELFYYDMLSPKNLDIADLILGDSKLVFSNEIYSIFLTEIA